MKKHDVTRLVQQGIDPDEIDEFLEHVDIEDANRVNHELAARDLQKGKKREKKKGHGDRNKRTIPAKSPVESESE